MNIGTKFILGIIVTTAFIFAGAMYMGTRPAKVYSENEILLTNTSVLGTKDSEITLVEFSDFQCPACRAYKPTVDAIMKKYSDKVYFGYRNFPLPQHEFAQREALAAEAAGKQGKFWEMYDYLFEHQTTLNNETIRQAAETIGLDMQQFENDVASDAIREQVAKDVIDGNRLGVNATPTFFLNGKKLQLRSPDDLLKAVETELHN